MEKKFFNTKNIILGLVALILICTSVTGVIVFLKDNGEAEAVEGDNQVQNLPVTGRDEQNNNENLNIPGAEEPENGNNTNSSENTNNQEQTGTTRRPTTGDIIAGIEETTRTEKQKVFEDLQLSWTTIGITTTTVKMGIYKPELQIVKTATEVVREGADSSITVDPNNKPMVRKGDTVIFTIEVSNVGNYKATNVIVTDSLDVIFEGKEVKANDELVKIATLNPGKAAVLKVGYVVTQADVETFEEIDGEKVIKNIVNVATATDGKTTVTDDDDIPVNPDVTLEVNKVWEDNENQDGKRPEKIEVELYANGIATGEKATVKQDEGWSYTFTKLAKYDENKKEIRYSVVENEVAEYETEYKNTENVIEIINTHKPEATKVEGTKTWDDTNNQDGKRPESITIRLKANGAEKASKTVTANDNWKWSFEDLPVYENGVKIEYTITEDAVTGYTTKINGYNVTNTHKPETTKVEGTKTWDDANNQDGKRPESITIRLKANGAEKASKTVTANDNWKWSFKDLPVYENGVKIEYTITEDAVTGYTTKINGYNVTNKYVPEKTTISGKKTWVDYNNIYNSRPDNIIIKLLDGEKETGIETTVTKEDNWEWTFTDLPVYSNGNKIDYKVAEEEVEDYESEVTDYDVTNTYTEAPEGTITMNWDIESTTDSPVPVDVVFILDTSDSMVANNSTRGQKMVDAVNTAIKEILSYNKNNRVSVVGYSETGVMIGAVYKNQTHASVLLELGRYTAKSDNKYLIKDGKKVVTNVKEAGKRERYFERGTYTQAGIELGAKQLINSDGKTVNIDGKDVQRVPVIILLSDGEPTVFSTNYENPTSGTTLGTSQLANTSAAYGYYTILTANYYKQKVKEAYNKTPVKEFTIAMDLTTLYGETVLNPNSTNVNNCSTHIESNAKNQIENKNISKDLYSYLNLKDDITVNCSIRYVNWKAEYGNVTVIKNPYTNYSYADKAYKGSMTTDDLIQAMTTSITDSISSKTSHTIDEADRTLGKVYLDKIDTTKDFSLEIKDEITYTSYSEAESAGYVSSDTNGYFVDLTKLQGKTVTINYRQK